MDNPIVRLETDRLLVKTSCMQCYIDVGHSLIHEEFKFISISLLSTHVGWWSGLWRTRIAEAWRVLRGFGVDFVELVSVKETDALITALQIARREAFGSVQGDDQVRPEEAEGEEEEAGRQQGDAPSGTEAEGTESEQDHSHE